MHSIHPIHLFTSSAANFLAIFNLCFTLRAEKGLNRELSEEILLAIEEEVSNVALAAL
jgi:hypothetical protein